MKFLAVAVVLLSLSLRAQDVERRAAEAREAGRVPEAIALYREAVGNNPNWVEGWWYLGTLLYSSDQPREAAGAFARVLNLRGKDDGTAWAFLGLCLFDSHQYDKALSAFEAARTNWTSDNPELLTLARFRLAILLNRAGNHLQAQEILRVLAAENRNEPPIVAALGAAVLLAPQLPAEIPPEKQDLVMAVGRAAFLAAQNRSEEAKAAYESAVARYPRDPGVHYAYGKYLQEIKSPQAVEEFRAALKVDPAHAPSRLELAWHLMLDGQPDEAAAQARRAAEERPKWFATHLMLGKALLESGKVDEAIAALETSARLFPQNPEVHFQLGRALRLAKRPEDAAREEAEFRRLDAARKASLWGSGPK